MNIVYIHTHDTGRYIQPYGFAVPTPNLQHFAEQSLLFRHAYCVAPTCSPSRASLLSGMYPHVNGMIGLAHRGFFMKDPSQHLAVYLKGQGYETVLSGVCHEGQEIVEQGYNHVFKEVAAGGSEKFDFIDRGNASKAAAFIQQRLPRGKPFFLSFGMLHTHRPFNENPTGISPHYVMPPAPLFDNEHNRKDMATFMASARVMDECVGMVMEAIKEAGLEEETIVLFTTDHGIAFPFMKCNLYDSGIGVALMMRYPNMKRRGEATDTLVSHLDVFPTLCDLAGLEKPDWLQGHSMLPILEEDALQIRSEIFSEVTYHAAYEPMRCIRTERYKYIRRFDDQVRVVPANIDKGRGKEHVMNSGFLNFPVDREMLFDLALDPQERKNLIGSTSYKEVHHNLSSRLEQWMKDSRSSPNFCVNSLSLDGAT